MACVVALVGVGTLVACDAEELDLDGDAMLLEPELDGEAFDTTTGESELEPVFGDEMNEGPNVFAGSSEIEGAELLIDIRDGEQELLAPDLDPEVLRSHGAEPMQDQLDVTSSPQEGVISSPAGYGHYCSMTWPSGGWALAWDSNGNDPCAYLINNSDPGGTIQRAGMFSSSATNQVVTRCSDGAIYIYRGSGGGPLSAAFNASLGRRGCIHTASPQALPIFRRSPIEDGIWANARTGVDFARGSITSLNTFEFGEDWQEANVVAEIVDSEGRSREGNWIDGHDAYDYNIERGTPLYAVANGNIIASRWLDTQCMGSDSSVQGEVYVRHTVSRNPSTYNESFVAAYFHLETLLGFWPGLHVSAGTYLGQSGNTGCSSQAHLHFAVVRETNVANAHSAPIQVTPDGNSGGGRTIDPYGWYAPENIDPWAWRAFPDGAFSVNLWESGAAPHRGNWGYGID